MSIIRDMSVDLGLLESDLLKISVTAPRRYKVYRIAKRQPNMTRVIAQPAREVKALQRWIIKHVLADLPVHEAATAYKRGAKIKFNAATHADGRFLLKMDFQNFFPSIKPSDFWKHLDAHKNNYQDKREREFLTKLLFWIPPNQESLRLSVGAPSSPAISNTIMYEFDVSCHNLCNSRSVQFTRYADDLAFSTSEPNVLNGIHDEVVALVERMESPDLTLNAAKTVFASKKTQRRVTGLILTNDGQVSLGRARKRLIRAAVNNYSHDQLDHDSILTLQGWLAFAIDVEESFVNRLQKKYGMSTINSLLRRK